MTANSNRFSTYTSTSVGTGSEEKKDDQKKDMWSSMLDSVASGKRLPEKNMLVLGGSVDSQREFLEALSSTGQRRNIDRQNSVPPIANSFALGYTYYNVLDADQEDILARVSLYLLSSPAPSFASLIKPLLTPQSIPNTLIVVLLDWSQPWSWMRQLREWLMLLRNVIFSLSPECKEAMEEVISSWRERGRTGGSVNLDGTGAVATEKDVSLPLGPGEWEDALGLPLCVVCQNSERIDYLEKTQGWKEEKFDLVLQYLRTALLRHGASLIYTAPTMMTPLQSLVHASLGIHSLLKRSPLKHNVIDRDKIVVPPNWDSWGKIRVLRDGFDVESISEGWSIDINQPSPTSKSQKTNGVGEDEIFETNSTPEPEGSAVAMYEEQVQDTSLDALQLAQGNKDTNKLEVPSVDTQAFLGNQLGRLEQQKKDDEKTTKENSFAQVATDDIISDHIGPVQFNMGGIQVDADDMVQRLKDRQAYGQSPEPLALDDATEGEPAPQVDTDTLAKFFGNLMNRKPASGGALGKT